MAESEVLMAPRLDGSRTEAAAWSRSLLEGSMACVSATARRLEESRLQAETLSRLLSEGSRADPQALAQAQKWLKAKAQAKAKAKGKGIPKGPTWAEYRAMEKRLESMDDEITALSFRLDMEKFRCCFGDRIVKQIFPSKPSCSSQPSDDELTVMAVCMEFVYELEKRRLRQPSYGIEKNRSFSGISGELDSKRLRKDDELSEEEDDSHKPRHIKDMEKALLCLEREYLRLRSEKRAPDFSGMTEAERAAEAERLRVEAFQKAERLLVKGDIVGAQQLRAQACVLDFDPKKGGIYYNVSLALADLPGFDLAEESPIGPMRFTDKVYKEREMQLEDAVNILSVKVASSDVGFPIQVYGTVVARDCTDYKRVYLFQRDREHCQLINSKNEPLILTGPKRGLLLLDENYIETDLMIKDHQGQDRELSKGVLTISGIAGRSREKCEVDALSLATRLSTVNVVYAYVVSAVEATVSLEVLEGEFCGIVTARTAIIKNRLVLYDSQLADDHLPGRGAIKMMRPVISVHFRDTLVIIARVHGGKAKGFKITPRISNGDEVEFTLGTAKMRMRVAWSILDWIAAEH